MKWGAAILGIGMIIGGCSSDAKPAATTAAATTAAANTSTTLTRTATTSTALTGTAKTGTATTGTTPISPATSVNAPSSTGGAFGGTHSAACDTDLTAVQTAVEAYFAINGGQDVTEAQLVQAGLLRQESTLHDIGPQGTVVASPTGGCAS